MCKYIIFFQDHDNSREPWVYLKCGHIYSYHEWKAEPSESNSKRTCPMCREVSLDCCTQLWNRVVSCIAINGCKLLIGSTLQWITIVHSLQTSLPLSLLPPSLPSSGGPLCATRTRPRKSFLHWQWSTVSCLCTVWPRNHWKDYRVRGRGVRGVWEDREREQVKVWGYMSRACGEGRCRVVSDLWG